MGAFLGKGIVQVAPINATTSALSGAWVDLGEVENFSPGADITAIEKYTSRDSSNALIARVETQINTKIALTLIEPNTDNLQIIQRASIASVAASPITDESVVVTGLVAGDYIFSKYPIGTLTSIKDSAGSPATLTGGGTDYTVIDLDYGQVQLVNVAGYTQPFKFNYTPPAHSEAVLFGSSPNFYRVRIDGINIVDSLKFTFVYRKVRFSPATEFPLIGTDFATYPLEGAALRDENAISDAQGPYGYFVSGL